MQRNRLLHLYCPTDSRLTYKELNLGLTAYPAIRTGRLKLLGMLETVMLAT